MSMKSILTQAVVVIAVMFIVNKVPALKSIVS